MSAAGRTRSVLALIDQALDLDVRVDEAVGRVCTSAAPAVVHWWELPFDDDDDDDDAPAPACPCETGAFGAFGADTGVAEERPLHYVTSHGGLTVAWNALCFPDLYGDWLYQPPALAEEWVSPTMFLDRIRHDYRESPDDMVRHPLIRQLAAEGRPVDIPRRRRRRNIVGTQALADGAPYERPAAHGIVVDETAPFGLDESMRAYVIVRADDWPGGPPR